MVWKGWFLYQSGKDRYLEISIARSSSGILKLYYDQGFGFNEHDSVAVYHAEDNGPFLSKIFSFLFGMENEIYKKHRFQLTPPILYAFRLMYLKGGDIHIKNINIIDGIGNVLHTIQTNHLRPSINVSSIEVNSTSARFRALGNQKAAIDIQLSSLLRMVPGKIASWIYYFKQVFLCAVFLAGTGALICIGLINTPVVNKLAPFFMQISKNLQKLFQPQAIFIFLTAIILWFYGFFSTSVFPVLFEKIFFLIFFSLSIRYFLKREEKDKNIDALIAAMALFFILVAVSAIMNYFALNATAYERIDLRTAHFRHDSPLIDKYEAIERTTDSGYDADQSAFLYLVPFLFIVTISIFRSTDSMLKMLQWIPLLFIPNLLITIYECKGSRILDENAGIGDNVFLLRLLLFLIFPLCVLSFVTVKKWWKKTLYALIGLVILWLTPLSHGRNTMIGIILFVFFLPMIRFWVFNKQKTLSNYIYLGAMMVIGSALVAGFMFPRYHGVMSKVFTKRMVKDCHKVLSGDIKGALRKRAEMVITAGKLIAAAPISGWGPAAFQKNANRIRYLNGEKPGVSHAMTSVYLQTAGNFGLTGLSVMLFIHVFPIWMVFSIRNKIQGYEHRWAVGIVFVTVCIFLIISAMNPNFGYPESSWLYAVYMGFLIATALEYNYRSGKRNKGFKAAGTLIFIAVFSLGTYDTTFGEKGYRAIQKDLITRITNGYSPVDEKRIWDNKNLMGKYKTKNRLIKTRGNPFRKRYTTNVLELEAVSDTLSRKMPGALFCIKTIVEDDNRKSDFFINLHVFMNGKEIKPHHNIQMEGEYLLFYYYPKIKNRLRRISVKVDMWRAIPYHEDFRNEIEAEYMPYHPDYQDFDLNVNLVQYGPKQEKT
ncbi:MAG: O-antigen ligase family protein [Promethearchaeota archaeon]